MFFIRVVFDNFEEYSERNLYFFIHRQNSYVNTLKFSTVFPYPTYTHQMAIKKETYISYQYNFIDLHLYTCNSQ